MSEPTVAGAGTAQGGTPNGVPASPATSQVPPATPAVQVPGTGTPEDIQAQQELYRLMQGDGTGTIPATGVNGTGGDLQTQIAHWKEMARKNEQRAAENFRKATDYNADQEDP